MVQGFCERGQRWVYSEVERISNKLERYKSGYNGYNRIQPILISKSVTSILNNHITPPSQQRTNTGANNSPTEEERPHRFRRHCSTRIT